MTKKIFFFHTTNCRNLWFNILKWFKKQQQGTLRNRLKKIDWFDWLTYFFFSNKTITNDTRSCHESLWHLFSICDDLGWCVCMCFTFFQSFFLLFLDNFALSFSGLLVVVMFFSPWNLAYLDFLYIWHFWPRSKDLAMRTNGSLLIYRERQIDMKWV